MGAYLLQRQREFNGSRSAPCLRQAGEPRRRADQNGLRECFLWELRRIVRVRDVERRELEKAGAPIGIRTRSRTMSNAQISA